MIVKMKRLTITGLRSERAAIVKQLMKMGVVELADMPMTQEEREQVQTLAEFEDASKRIGEIEEELRKIKNAQTFLQSFEKGKSKRTKREMSFAQFVDAQTYKGVWELVFNANALQKDILEKKATINQLHNEIAGLSTWSALDLPAGFEGTQSTFTMAGTVPGSTDIDQLARALDQTELTLFELLGFDDQQYEILVTAHISIQDTVMELLREAGFSKAVLGIQGFVKENMEARQKQVQLTQAALENNLQEAETLAQQLPRICDLYDYIYNMQLRRKVRHHFLNTEKVFFVGGWAPADVAQEVKQSLEQQFTIQVEIGDAAQGEEAPVLLRNNWFVYPHEAVTELYGLPKPWHIDPNPVMAPFFCLFFGLMVSDAGYGLLTALLCFIALKVAKFEGMMDKLVRLIAFGSLSTALWGALFGGWFGDFFSQALGIEIAPLWFNPIEDPMTLLVFSLIFGTVHLFVALGVNGYIMARDGKWYLPLLDVVPWYFMIGGICGMLCSMLLAGTFAMPAVYSLAVGAVLLILTQGRREKNIFMKLFKGIASLYDAISYISDILSYSRLLALGLATGVIGAVINTMGMMGGGFSNLIGAVLLIVVFIAGHTLNIVINTFGAFVHASRLQYVEFFGKFYESGGRAFAPLATETKYIKIKSNMGGK